MLNSRRVSAVTKGVSPLLQAKVTNQLVMHTHTHTHTYSTSPVSQRFKQTGATEEYLKPVSTIPTYHFQASLPRLPIPKLQDTLDKVRRALFPLLLAWRLTTVRLHSTPRSHSPSSRLPSTP